MHLVRNHVLVKNQVKLHAIGFQSNWGHFPPQMIPLAEQCELVGDRDIFGGCTIYNDPSVMREHCRADICVNPVQKAEGVLCNYVAAYARECRRLGFTVDWMSSAVGNVCKGELTHLPLDKMAAISQTICSDAFSWLKILYFYGFFYQNFTEVCS